MNEKTIQSQAAGLLRKAVNSQAPPAQPGEEPKPAEPATPAEPAATTN